jgi:hypothetical protein
MGLFATLTSSASEAGKTRSSASEVPSIVQLYSNSPIRFGACGKNRNFSILSYQAVNVGPSATEGGGALLSKQDQVVHPNLGVWNLRVTKPCNGFQNAVTNDVFGKIPIKVSETPCVCMSVSLANLDEVEPTITMLQDALVHYLISRGEINHKSATKPASATTSLFDLRSVQFGLAVNDKGSAKSMAASSPDEQDRNVNVSLVISVVIPSKAEVDTTAYKEKQAEALVLYHLRKYATSLNAVLCFVRTDELGEEEPNAVDAISINQLSHVWHQLAKGEEGWKVLDPPVTSLEEESEAPKVESVVSGVYGPGSHQEDLIESVLLRNAHFPGHWDASNDSLWVALPTTSVADGPGSVSTSDQAAAGDDSWLRELRSAIASDVKTPPPSINKEPGTESKTPNDAAVSSFFESLLKP